MSFEMATLGESRTTKEGRRNSYIFICIIVLFAVVVFGMMVDEHSSNNTPIEEVKITAKSR